MDQGTLLKIAKLRTMASRQGKGFDVVRFASDRAFARETLAAIMDTEDEPLLMAGLELMEALKMTASDNEPAAVPPTVATATPPPPPTPKAIDQRYVGRLR